MIDYSYSNDAGKTVQDRQKAKQDWIDHLGKFYDEFDKMNGFVSIDFSTQDEDGLSFSFSIGDSNYRHDFIKRFNEWVEGGRL